MRHWLRRIFQGCLLGLLAAAGFGIYTVVDTLPTLPDPAVAPVQGMPPQSGEVREPWQGTHPRLDTRPPETFSFPVRPGETGPVEPLYAGPRQYPFYCGEDNTRPETAQPRVDNQEGHGVPVFAVRDGEKQTDEILGYSKDCQHPTHVRYYYMRQGTERFFPLEQARDDIARIEVEGREIDYVVRLETGTINRFFYGIAALRGSQGSPESPSDENWSGRLVYQFDGGVGIGRNQGDFSAWRILGDRDKQLRQGDAVVYSTANQTQNHFDMRLAEDTARRVKRQFTALYGEPRYTIGIGGSGGAIQQYLFAQNSPGLIDGAIALYSYPDMVTQTIHVQDCELLEYFFEVTDADNPLWQDWDKRQWIEGMNARSGADNRFAPAQMAADLLRGRISRLFSGEAGSSTCVSGWRGLIPLISNPHFLDNPDDYVEQVRQQVNWTYWDDLAPVFGRNRHGHAFNPWDNTGVQYGLQALREGRIDPETFLRLNARVGSWKPAHEMQPEKFWFLTGGLFPVEFSLWSEQNMRLASDESGLAPRRRGSREAARAAYRSGQVFLGFADIPIIDARHYLDPELDMHHLIASFSSRARMQRARGHADNQLIWVSDRPHDPRGEAFRVMRHWLENRRGEPEASAAETRPGQARDRCYDADGRLLAEGGTVWNGAWNGRPEGECMQRYPAHSTSRQIAGGPVSGDVFQCRRQSVEEAIDSGVYEPVDMRPWRERLALVFPRGVCDYAAADTALPQGLIQSLREAESQ